MKLADLSSRQWMYTWFGLGATCLVLSVAVEAGSGRTASTEPFIQLLTTAAIVFSLLALGVSLRANRRNPPPDK